MTGRREGVLRSLPPGLSGASRLGGRYVVPSKHRLSPGGRGAHGMTHPDHPKT